MVGPVAACPDYLGRACAVHPGHLGTHPGPIRILALGWGGFKFSERTDSCGDVIEDDGGRRLQMLGRLRPRYGISDRTLGFASRT